MNSDEYRSKRLQVEGIEVVGDGRVSAQGTRVRLSNGMYLGDVQDLSLNGNGGDMWTVDVTVRTTVTSQQVLELFEKIGHETTQTTKQTTSDDTEGTETNQAGQ